MGIQSWLHKSHTKYKYTHKYKHTRTAQRNRLTFRPYQAQQPLIAASRTITCEPATKSCKAGSIHACAPCTKLPGSCTTKGSHLTYNKHHKSNNRLTKGSVLQMNMALHYPAVGPSQQSSGAGEKEYEPSESQSLAHHSTWSRVR